MALSESLRRVRRFALWLGAIELPLLLLWSVAGAGFYGSPLYEVDMGRGGPIILVLFFFGGPIGLLPMAILSGWWPRAVGFAMLAGATAAVVLSAHPWGLGYAAPNLYVDVWPGFFGISFVTMAIGIALVATGRVRRGAAEATAIGLVSLFATLETLSVLEHRVAFAPYRTLHPIRFVVFPTEVR